MQASLAGIKVGPFLLSTFGLIVVVAILAGAAITWVRARHSGQSPAIALDLGASMLFYAIVLGRLFFVFAPPPSVADFYSRDWYFSHPLDLLAGPVAVWNGGLGTAGVVVGAFGGAVLVLRSKRVDLWEWADLLLPGALAAAAILPLANLAAGQLLGPSTSLPWGVPGAAAGATATSSFNLRYHPTPAYLSLWGILIAIVTVAARRRFGQTWLPGQGCLYAGLMYFPGLFMAEILRIDVSRSIFALSGAQVLCVIAEIALILLIIWRARARNQLTGAVTKFIEN
jgi:phosphatidylglycerol:prolipoprotein diacylglycerol transferase